MKTMKSILMMAVLCLGTALLLQSCEPNPAWSLSSGEVKFKVSTTWDHSRATKTIYADDLFEVSTKTSYSGDNVGGYERIDWVVNDMICIYSPELTRPSSENHEAKYYVKEVTPSTTKESYATLDNADGNGLTWSESVGTASFYALYPYTVLTATDYNNLGLTLPTTQEYILEGTTLKPKMDLAFMYAAVRNISNTSTVDLAFKPMYTAFQFTVDSGDDDVLTLSSLTLSSASKAMAGSYTAAVTAAESSQASTVAYNFTSADASDANKAITLSFGSDGLTIQKGSPITFTLFALPRDYNDLTVSFQTVSSTSSSGGLKTIELKKNTNEAITFYAEHKYNINLGGIPGQLDYVLTLDQTGLSFDGVSLSAGGAQKDLKVRSYRQRSTATKEAVPWKVQALASDGTTWVDYGDAEWPIWLQLSAYSGDGSTTTQGETITVFIRPDPETVSVSEVGNSGSMAALTGAPSIGSDTEPRDLSLYDIYGNLYVAGTNEVPSIKKAGSHTANCYVVSAPGWYCFPLVYGNAIDQTHGGNNTQAYNKYRNVNNGIISSPYILSDLGVAMEKCDAVVVWQDQLSGKGVIREDVEVVSAPSGAGLDCPYIKFHIDRANILPGNIMIALRDKSAGDTPDKARILWSWHIWVTPVPHSNDSDIFKIRQLTWRTEESTSTETLSTIDILNCNLGWSSPLKFSIDQTGATKLRFVQDYGSHDPVSCSVDYHDGEVYAGTYSGCTYYQWGRKDPFLPSNGGYGASATNRVCYSPANYIILNANNTIKGLQYNSLSANPAMWSQNPYVVDGSYNMAPPYDAWNSANDGTEHGIYISNTNTQAHIAQRTAELMSRVVKKTVYDPSPAGFCVPIGRAFTGFTIDGATYSINPSSPVYNPNGICGVRVGGSGSNPPGVNFSYSAQRQASTYTLYFAGSSSRCGTNSYGQVPGLVGIQNTNQAGYYWTSVPSDVANNDWHDFALLLTYLNTDDPQYVNMWQVACIMSQPSSDGFTVRPMVEQDGLVVIGENLSAWDE